jgi:hypothetical protein
MKTNFLRVLVLSLSIVVSSCGGSGTDEKKETSAIDSSANEADTLNEVTEFKFQLLIANLPSPFEVISRIVFDDLKPQKADLLDLSKKSKYISDVDQGLALGALGADLTYANLSGDFSKSIEYLDAIRTLSVNLGIESQYDAVASKYVINLDNPNSEELLKLSDELYHELDKYLVSASKQRIALAIFSGAWLESFYLSLQQVSGDDDNEMTKKVYDSIWEQKRYFPTYYGLLKDYEGDKRLGAIYKQLNDFNKLIGSMSEADRNAEFVAKLYVPLAATRNKNL